MIPTTKTSSPPPLQHVKMWWPPPQPAPASCKDSLVASPSTTRSTPAPTSHYNLLVPFFSSPSTTVATHSTNKSLWLVGALPSLSLSHGSHTQHQQVITTCWCSSFPLPWQRQPHTAPTSRNDLLVLFLPSPLTMAVTHSTNKSLRLVGAFSFFSLNHGGHTQHQRVVKTHWCLSIPLPQPWQSLTAPTSHCDSLVPFLSSPSTTAATRSTNESLWLVGAFSSFSLDNASHTHT